MINAEVCATAQRRKRKIHKDYLAIANELESARKAFRDAQDKVVLLRRKHVEMKRHHCKGEENYNTTTDINQSATIKVAEAIASNEEPGCIDKLREIATLSHAILKSATVELGRLNRKFRYAERNLQSVRCIAADKVLEFKEH